MILLHMGSLHPIEKALTLVLALAPFVILAAVVLIRRRQDRAELEQEQTQGQAEDAQRDR